MPRQPKDDEESRFLGINKVSWVIIGVFLSFILLIVLANVVNSIRESLKPDTTPGVVAKFGPLSGEQQERAAEARARARVEQQDASQFAELSDLYYELMDFKDDPEFHKYGFGTGGAWHGWLERVQALMNASTFKQRVATGDIFQLGREYVRSGGTETKFTRWAKQQIEAALAEQ